MINLARSAQNTTMTPRTLTPAANSKTEEQHWAAVLRRDRSFDGKFVFGVSTTGIYCRPSCPSRRPRRENVSFFASTEAARRAGLRACMRCKPERGAAAPEPLERARQLLESSEDERVTLQDLAKVSGLSASHLQREFKRQFGMSPKDYRRAFRMKSFKREIRKTDSVTAAMLDAGFPTSRSFYEKASATLGMVPTKYRDGGAQETLRWATLATKLGRVVIASSERGLCTLEFIDDEAKAAELLHKEFPSATLVRDQQALNGTASTVRALIDQGTPLANLSLDLRGTAFQLAVWDHLRKIAVGKTESYAEVAAGLGRPSAVRAVARACASNRVAVVVPCHRVVRSDGDVSGYKWGVERKKKLLAAESRGH